MRAGTGGRLSHRILGDEAVVILPEIANFFGSIVELLKAHWCDSEGLAALFGVSTEQLIAMFKAAGTIGKHNNKKVTTPQFSAVKFKKCLELNVDATIAF